MTKTTIFTALRLVLSLAMAGPVQAWPGPAAVTSLPGVGCVWRDGRTDCGAAASISTIPIAHVRKAAAPHPRLRSTEHATTALPPATRLPDRDEDSLATMHFE